MSENTVGCQSHSTRERKVVKRAKGLFHILFLGNEVTPIKIPILKCLLQSPQQVAFYDQDLDSEPPSLADFFAENEGHSKLEMCMINIFGNIFGGFFSRSHIVQK